ncbi:NADPH:quinone reductase-like Zn-dependent oxidoreductase [Lewinella aquimaris]|uniref:NADPH:quinone reductase-like Zn-dependent oxidoreductase n=1 Tax=Neolewinella aquimaris TaxID=1835722 RepID=A0A840EFS0_9BACT|nr:NAD(P)-dependent alcohol dehydrogenase [Neolewinella aquimaris]MBB4080768.1 NADPH:quinone reductase-like Zn-dependent oxidoreductase [Neolewinella aquimaris]
MKAGIRRNYCNPDGINLESVALPQCGDKEVLIRVVAATVNRTDCANLAAKPFLMRFVLGFFRPKEIILGTDFAGEIVSVGKSVSSCSVGDSVFGFNDTGSRSHAEYTAVAEENVYAIPENIDYRRAAASLEGGTYAYSFLRKVSVRPQQRILINGASGAIGSALLQFLREYDVRIAATCNAENIELVKSLGADRVYDYTKENVLHGGEVYDHIFDAVGKWTFGKCKPLLKRNGTYTSSELGPYFQNVIYSLLTSSGSKKVIFPIPCSQREFMPFIESKLVSGRFSPVIDREYSLSDISNAYAYVITGQKTGNVMLNIWR